MFHTDTCYALHIPAGAEFGDQFSPGPSFQNRKVVNQPVDIFNGFQQFWSPICKEWMSQPSRAGPGATSWPAARVYPDRSLGTGSENRGIYESMHPKWSKWHVYLMVYQWILGILGYHFPKFDAAVFWLQESRFHHVDMWGSRLKPKPGDPQGACRPRTARCLLCARMMCCSCSREWSDRSSRVTWCRTRVWWGLGGTCSTSFPFEICKKSVYLEWPSLCALSDSSFSVISDLILRALNPQSLSIDSDNMYHSHYIHYTWDVIGMVPECRVCDVCHRCALKVSVVADSAADGWREDPHVPIEQ